MEPFLGEVKIFGFNYAPRGWGFCDGGLVQISQFTALFSILGTTYGGDGRVSFALPNLQGRAPMHPGSGPDLTPRILGERGGTDSVSLKEANLPAHNHAIYASTEKATQKDPSASAVLAKQAGRKGGGAKVYSTDTSSLTAMGGDSLSKTGGGQPHTNMQPYLSLNFCIALQGLYPARN